MGTGMTAPTELSCIQLWGQCLSQENVPYVRYFHDRGKQVQKAIAIHPVTAVAGPRFAGFP